MDAPRLRAPRIGVVLTAANSVLERDLWRSDIREATWHSSRLPATTGNIVHGRSTADESRALADGTLDAIRTLRPLEPELIVIGLSGAPFRNGVQGHERWKQELEQVADVPVITLADALLADVETYNLQRVGLLTPFAPSSSADIRAFFAEAGIHVAASVDLDCESTAAIARVQGLELENAAREVDMPDPDGILQVGTNLDFAPLEAQLSRSLAKPVIAANAAIARLAEARIRQTS
jgi:maleate isomerase